MLREQVADEFAKSGVDPDRIDYRHYVRMQYFGQLNDLEVYAPHQAIEETEHVDALIAAFEDAYGKRYARSARSPELGYLVTDVIVTGSVPVEKPALPDEAADGAGPPEPKGRRPVWWKGGFADTPIYEQDVIRAGQAVAGPAVIESPADTFAIPPGRRAELDANRVFHLQGG
jgi:acetone carboxylase beta subunit